MPAQGLRCRAVDYRGDIVLAARLSLQQAGGFGVASVDEWK
jgi:hypothetical protein